MCAPYVTRIYFHFHKGREEKSGETEQQRHLFTQVTAIMTLHKCTYIGIQQQRCQRCQVMNLKQMKRKEEEEEEQADMTNTERTTNAHTRFRSNRRFC